MKTFLIIFSILSVLFFYVSYFNSIDILDITIKDKTAMVKEDGGYYLVFTEHEVFENTDQFIIGKFNSSDIQNQLEFGYTYKVKAMGWRVPFLSWYRNIIYIY